MYPFLKKKTAFNICYLKKIPLDFLISNSNKNKTVDQVVQNYVVELL